ncbi:ejaculatory bulb-specific protein 3-like [Pseudomyrmex gracilis]|uniref:ejaculatory bulb-specific protein 3-like n=1 Tax=Pseudomyrmex gracilis TaxID=219809 RepID=UPI000994B68C|nr:ejaculatory bulb-specific protein 3-like [Pseudomyrmex gracilis]
MNLSMVVLLFVFSGFVSGTEEEFYSDTYDNVDIDAILGNERLVKQYMNCILDKGSCTADGRSLRRILPDALATTCKKCNQRQREIARKIGNYLKTNRPEEWAEFVRKFDPNNQYIVPFDRFLAKVE